VRRKIWLSRRARLVAGRQGFATVSFFRAFAGGALARQRDWSSFNGDLEWGRQSCRARGSIARKSTTKDAPQCGQECRRADAGNSTSRAQRQQMR